MSPIKTSHRQAHTEAFFLFVISAGPSCSSLTSSRWSCSSLTSSAAAGGAAADLRRPCRASLKQRGLNVNVSFFLFRLLPRRCKVKDPLSPALHGDSGAPAGVSGPAAGQQRVGTAETQQTSHQCRESKPIKRSENTSLEKKSNNCEDALSCNI